MRIGLGPVFVLERQIGSRRRQTYALRSLFVGGLLAALAVVYFGSLRTRIDLASFHALGLVGESLFYGLVGTQLTLVLLAAPAATAGAICLDRARGTLAHLLMTDLSSAEIVLGKLAARLGPVLGLVACALPVLILTSLLGGIDPKALLGAFLVTLGVALLGCALALLFSLVASRTHEALLGTYALLILWLLAPQISLLLTSYGLDVTLPVPEDPYRLAFAPYTRPGTTTLVDDLVFLGGAVVLTVAVVAFAVWRLRPIGTREAARIVRVRRLPFERLRRLLDGLPGPPLDGNPVLWREWHRNRPSRWARMVGGVYVLGAGAFSGMAISGVSAPGSPSAGTAAWVNGLQVVIGFLILSVIAATSLAEERVRGSLDVLMTTPLSSSTIVLGKWLGTFRLVPLLMIPPGLVAGSFALANGSGLAWLMLMGYLLSCGAMVTSLGLALAVWVRRLGRAVGLTVALYCLLAVGWLFLCLALFRSMDGEYAAMGSPFMGAGGMTFEIAERRSLPINHGSRYVGWGVLWIFLFAGLALSLLAATLLTFNRCLGRMPERVDWWRITELHPPKKPVPQVEV